MTAVDEVFRENVLLLSTTMRDTYYITTCVEIIIRTVDNYIILHGSPDAKRRIYTTGRCCDHHRVRTTLIMLYPYNPSN